MKEIREKVMEIMHEWHGEAAIRILAEMGVSERNWKFFMLHKGLADGKAWSLRRIADEDGKVSHVRVYQIVKKTERRLRQYLEGLK